ncbi:MAG: tetratricopeptide repeat protein [Planctomycetota bacterium]
MAYVRGDEGPAEVFYQSGASSYDETPAGIRRFVGSLESQTRLPRRGVPTWPTDVETVRATAAAFATAARNLFFEELDLDRDDIGQMDRFAQEHFVDPRVRKLFRNGELDDAETYGEMVETQAVRVPDEPLLNYAMGCWIGEWLVRHADARWFLFAPLKPVQSFPDALRTGTLTALSPFSLATKLLADPAGEALPPKVAVLPADTIFTPVALCASVSDSEHILAEMVGPAMRKATAMLQRGETDAAFDLLADEVDRQPTNGHLLHQVAMLGWEHEELAIVHEATRLQREVAPESVEVAHNFAAIESMREGGLEGAIAILEEILERDATYTRARLTLASCLHEAGRFDEARVHAQWLIDHDPELSGPARELLSELQR